MRSALKSGATILAAIVKLSGWTRRVIWPRVVSGHVGSAHKTIMVCCKIYLGPIGEYTILAASF